MYDKSYWSDHFMDYANEDEEEDDEGEDAVYRSALPSHTTSSDPDDPTRVFDGHPWPFYHESDPDETPRPEDDSSLAGILRNALLKTDPQLPVAGREENLPPNPKLQVDGVGSVTLPLTHEQSLRLIAQCELESKFKTHEKVYELDGKLVKLDDSEWGRSLDKLAEVVRSHLGLGRVGEDHEQVLGEPMHKLVLYDQGDVVLDGGAGGSAEKAAEATLIVPFSSSGGEVVVVETPGGVKTRHELTQIGSKKGENFIVVSSGSRCTVEGVQSGDVRDVLAPALEASGELDPIVLLLKNDYDSNVLAESGASALTGVDLARIQTIEKLNAVLPVNKKLQFFAVRLEHEIESVCTGESDYDDGLEKEHKDSIVWYTIEPTSNVTMPSDEDNKRFEARMRSGGYEEYDDPPSPTKHDRYSRYGVIILPRERAMEVIRKFSGNDAAAAYLQQYPTRDSAALRSLLTNGDYDTKEWNDAVCHSLVEMNDASLVHLFFEQVANIFCTANRVDISSAVPILVRGFGWEVIETPFLSCYASHSVYEHEVLEVLVHLANAFSGHDDQKRILESLLHEAKFWNPFYISSDYYKIELLWSCASHCSDITVFERFVILLKRSGPDCYGSMIQRLEKYSDEVCFSPRERVAFSDFVAARVHYLKAAVTNRGKPGEWTIPQACVPNEPEVEEFLRGPQRSKEFTGFPDKKAARVFMSRFTYDNCASMFSMECGRDRKFAIMTKTVTLTKHSHKHAPGDGFHLDHDEQLLKLMKKYYPDEDRSWIRETWAKQTPKSPKRFQLEQGPRSQKGKRHKNRRW
ncbi:hypothetical protein PF005_g23831 [Phytophthora fragariae]|uniref:Uncharacterized protein n=1 Tax=Phytophthora fragariae TaxID=53985 RepID=A0A6A3S6T5_9STRA|nr:hypothetical protein PF009_g24551 [Phytophthora fragariae]KAE9100892.1 hypothetical protein PF007_g15351 [Phytophthora fragariae]KAE9111024.1 hypothetical protein PF006_g20313 [Phytophthora fragariae]KAE9179049.1 hypothetical protein PF005_g23831 [Phytophthora fragariae]KAE9218511.1 hypothetical protein PF002_g16487 [Phytophthora fragariae]